MCQAPILLEPEPVSNILFCSLIMLHTLTDPCCTTTKRLQMEHAEASSDSASVIIKVAQ